MLRKASLNMLFKNSIFVFDTLQSHPPPSHSADSLLSNPHVNYHWSTSHGCGYHICLTLLACRYRSRCPDRPPGASQPVWPHDANPADRDCHQSGKKNFFATIWSILKTEMEFSGDKFNKRLKSFAPCFSQSLLLADFFIKKHTLLWFEKSLQKSAKQEKLNLIMNYVLYNRKITFKRFISVYDFPSYF